MKNFTPPKELTREEALQLYESGVWKNWSNEQLAGFQLWQEYLCVPFDRFHEAVQKTLGRPVYTHEFGTEGSKRLQLEYLGVAKAATLTEILNLIPKDKQIIIVDGSRDGMMQP